MLSRHFVYSRLWLTAALAILMPLSVSAATFGKVVSIGGNAADLALDEPRGLLYIANYTSGRIDVMSTSDNTITRSISVAAYPGGVALSPDGRYLVVTHYASSGGSSLLQPGTDALTVIDLNNNNQKRTYGLSSGPVGVAFGNDGLALILTQTDFDLFDPASGVVTVLGSVRHVLSATLPVSQGSLPSDIIAGSLAVTPDGKRIYGIGGVTPDTGSGSEVLLFSYNVPSKRITASFGLLTAPSLGPRSISVSRDGSYYMTGWALLGCGRDVSGDCTARGPLLAQVPGVNPALGIGSVAIRSNKSQIYAQFDPGSQPGTSSTDTKCFDNGICFTVTTPGTPAVKSSAPTNLMVMDSDNLAVRERIQIPESLAGKSVFNSDESVLYSVSVSGVTVFPLAQLDKAPRVVASQEDVVFRGNFCNSSAVTQQIDITDPSGNAVPFQICAQDTANSNACVQVAGVTFSPSSGVTPAKVKVTVDPTVLRSVVGTASFKVEILSAAAVNMPRPPSRGKVETDYKANVRSRIRILINNREPANRGAFFNIPGELVDTLADPNRNRFYVLRQDTNQVLVFDATTYAQIAALRTGNTPTQMAITFDRSALLVANDNSGIANRFDLNSLQPMSPIIFPIGHYPRSIAVSAKAILAASRVAGPVHTIDSIDLASAAAYTLPSLGPFKNDISVTTTLTAAPNGGSIFGAMGDGRTLLYNANVDAFTVTRKDFTSLKGAIAASNYGSYVVDHYFLNDSLTSQGNILSSDVSSSGFAFVDQDGYAATASKTGTGYMSRFQSGSGSPLPTMIVESPILSDADTDFPFRRTLAPLADRSAIIALTTSGFTVLPWNYDAATVPPVMDRIVSAADFSKPIAPGGLVSIFGKNLSPMTLSSVDVPLPTVLADSCLTVGGLVIPIIFVSPTQINAQLPFQVSGNTEVVLRTPGGISDALKTTILPAAPSVFRSGAAGPVTGLATIVRASNGELVTNSNPIHLDDHIVIYLTGMGQTTTEIPAGSAAPNSPLIGTLLPATVTLGSTSLFVDFAGLAPGLVGVYQINATVPFRNVATGFDIPLTITQGGISTTIPVRVLQ